jgi:hypothetical protein
LLLANWLQPAYRKQMEGLPHGMSRGTISSPPISGMPEPMTLVIAT